MPEPGTEPYSEGDADRSNSGSDTDMANSPPSTMSSPFRSLAPSPIPEGLYPSNGYWTIFGRDCTFLYAQPYFLRYPLFVPIIVERSILLSLGVDCIPDGPLGAHRVYKQKEFYRVLLEMLTKVTFGRMGMGMGMGGFEETYMRLQFNCCAIMVQETQTEMEMGQAAKKVKVRPVAEIEAAVGITARVERADTFECATRSVCSLASTFGFSLPPVVPLTELRLVTFLHDTVALVTIGGDNTRYAFKTNNTVSCLYEELHTLLTLAPHPNVISPPCYLVTKPTAYSISNPGDPASLYCLSPNQPIIGFLTRFLPGGTLKDHITHNPATPVTAQAKWAHQIARAMHHVFVSGRNYTALKMDNLVLDVTGDVQLLDFETAGSWAEYTPAEIVRADRSNVWGTGTGPRFEMNKRGKGCYVCDPHPCGVPFGAGRKECWDYHEEVMVWKFSGASVLCVRRPNSELEPIGGTPSGWWGKASRREAEAAMVWMVAACLWCVFEGEGCLKDGQGWRLPKWRRALGKVDKVVLVMVGNALKDDVEVRPRLGEMVEMLREWEQRVLASEVRLEEMAERKREEERLREVWLEESRARALKAERDGRMGDWYYVGPDGEEVKMEEVTDDIWVPFKKRRLE